MDSDNDDEFELQLINKEKELNQIHSQRNKALEQKLDKKNQQLKEMEQKYLQLNEDFNYNLNVIEERDKDINELSEKIFELKGICDEKQQNIQSFQVKFDNQKQKHNQLIEEMHTKTEVLYEKIQELKNENKFLKGNISENTKNSSALEKELLNKICKYEGQIQERQQSHQQEMNNALDEQKIKFQSIIQNLNQQIILQQKENEQNLIKMKQELEKQLNQNQQLQDQIYSIKSQHQQKSQEYEESQQSIQLRIKELNLELDNLNREKDRFQMQSQQQEDRVKEQREQLKQETLLVSEKLIQKKKKYKQEIQITKNSCDKMIQSIKLDNESKLKKMEQQQKLQDISIEKYKLTQTHLEDKLKEYERRFQNNENQNEIQYKQYIESIENDKKKLNNDLEIKDFQMVQINKDKKHLDEQLKQNQLKYSELEIKYIEISKENQILIQEVLDFRKQQNIPDKQPKLQKPKFSIDIAESAEFSDDLKDEAQNMMEFFDNASSKIKSKYHNKSPNNDSLKQSQEFLIKKIKAYETDINNYKIIIENLTREMENVQQRHQLQIRETQIMKEENLNLRAKVNEVLQDMIQYKERNFYLENQMQKIADQIQTGQNSKQTQYNEAEEKIIQLKTEISDKQTELQEKTKKLKNYQKEIEKLKKERLQLIEISTELQAKIRRQEEFGDLKGSQTIQIYENKESQSIIMDLQNKNILLSEQINSWKKLDEEKNNKIKKLKEFAKANNDQRKSMNIIDDEFEYEGVIDLDQNIEQFKKNWDEIKEELDHDFQLKSRQIDIQRVEGAYQKNSDKQTPSQKIVEMKLKQKRKQSPKVMNYTKFLKKE